MMTEESENKCECGHVVCPCCSFCTDAGGCSVVDCKCEATDVCSDCGYCEWLHPMIDGVRVCEGKLNAAP